MSGTRWLVGLLSVCVASSVLACGDDDGGARRDAAVDASTGGDSGGTAGTLRVLVEGVAVAGVPPAEPVEGVTVTADLPGGARVEATSGADGRVSFEGVDWALGDATVMAFSAGHLLAAVTGVTEATGEVSLLLVPRFDPTRVGLSGTAMGMTAASNGFVVTSTEGGFSEGTGPLWEMEVPADTAGTLVATEFSSTPSGSGRGQAFEFHQWTTADYPASTTDATVHIDFASAATVSTEAGSFPVPTPERGASVLGDAVAFVRVSGRDEGGVFLGAQTRLDLSSDGSTFEYDLEYLMLPGVERPTTSILMTRSPEQSGVTMDGWPTAGMQDVQFLDPPTVLAPEFGVDLPWGDTIRWETADTEVAALIRVFTADDAFVMYLLVLPGRSSAALPALPSAVTAAELLPGGTPSASVGMCERAGPTLPGQCVRFANSRSFGLVP